MRIRINGNWEALDGPTTLTDLLESRYPNGDSVAVAVNGEFVPRGRHADCALSENDDVEIVSPQAGG